MPRHRVPILHVKERPGDDAVGLPIELVSKLLGHPFQHATFLGLLLDDLRGEW